MVDIKKLKEIEKGIVLAINDMTIHLNGLRQIIDEEVGKLPGPADFKHGIEISDESELPF